MVTCVMRIKFKTSRKHFTLFFNRVIISDLTPKNYGITGVCINKLSWHFTYHSILKKILQMKKCMVKDPITERLKKRP
jgi:hypothetical protein